MNTTKTTPKDFFLGLAATITLYISAVALINLSYSIINYYFPDALAGGFYSNSIAWPISALVVLIPIFYVLEWLIKRDIKIIPEKSEIWVQRWRIYLTLFLSGAVIAGDLISLINTYLNGEISTRFVYKFLVILVVLAIIFAYYILEKIGRSVKTRMILAYAGIGIVLIAIIFGFAVVGSPSKQRAIRFDNQRISDLQNMQWQVISYWQQKGKLPTSTTELQDPISGSYIPLDPENKTSYQYSVKDGLTFELCSIFSLTSEDTKGRGEYGYGKSYSVDSSYPGSGNDINNNWKHGAGRVCFERKIDPERYPVNKAVPARGL